MPSDGTCRTSKWHEIAKTWHPRLLPLSEKRSRWEPRTFHQTDHAAETAHPEFWRVAVYHLHLYSVGSTSSTHSKAFPARHVNAYAPEPTPAPSHLKSATCSESIPSIACTPLDLHCPPWKHGYMQHLSWTSSWPIRHGILSCRRPELRATNYKIAGESYHLTPGCEPFSSSAENAPWMTGVEFEIYLTCQLEFMAMQLTYIYIIHIWSYMYPTVKTS